MEFINHDTTRKFPERCSYLLNNGAQLQIRDEELTLTVNFSQEPDTVSFIQAGHFTRASVEDLILALKDMLERGFGE